MNPIILKVSGKVMDNPADAELLWKAVAKLQACDAVVVVHGGGKQVDELLEKLDQSVVRIDGIRVTPKSQIDIVAGVLAGQVNMKLVGAMKASGVKAVGLSLGSHGVLDCSVDTTNDMQFGRVGVPVVGDAKLVRTLISAGYVPVVSSVGVDLSGELLNVNADDAAAALAVSLRAESLLYVSDVAGVSDSHGKIHESISSDLIEGMIQNGEVVGGMAAKLRSAAVALEEGVMQACITSSAGAAAILRSEPSSSTTITLQEASAS
jgi:acetylglutamate kinase